MPSKVYSAPTEMDAVDVFRIEHPGTAISYITQVGDYGWEIGWGEQALTEDRFALVLVHAYPESYSYQGTATEGTFTWRMPWQALGGVPFLGSYLERMERGIEQAIVDAAVSRGVVPLNMVLEKRVQPLWVDYRMVLEVAPVDAVSGIGGGVGELTITTAAVLAVIVIAVLAAFGIVAHVSLTDIRDLIHGPQRQKVVRDRQGNIVRGASGEILYEDAGSSQNMVWMGLAAAVGLVAVLLLKKKGKESR